jgi:predicted DNA-binding transcriptional regulator AlpA
MSEFNEFFNGLVKENFVSQKNLAKLLNVSEATLIKMRQAGKAPEHVLLGERPFYLRPSIIDWLKQRTGNGIKSRKRGRKSLKAQA